MEKLQPLIKHKFWIITGVVLLLAIVGWWLGTSAKAAFIDQRLQTLNALNVPAGTNTPNKAYIEGIDQVNQELAKRQEELDNRLYDEQASLRTWPQHVGVWVEDKLFGDPIEYGARQLYAAYYREEVRQMLEQLPAYKYDEINNKETGQVFVYINQQTMPHIIPFGTWNDNPPTSQVMWEAEEDIWLTRAILNAIKKVNSDAGATKISDAPIPKIEKLILRGGSRGAEGGTGGAGTTGSEYDSNYSQMTGGVETPQFGGGEGYDTAEAYGGGGGGSSSINFKATIDMDLNKVFGPETLQMTQSDENAAVPAAGTSGGIQGKRRYIDDDPALPYKTRGFYIEVLMRHEKLPDLQASLVSMPWPTELLMVHQVSDSDDKIRPVKTETNQPRLPPATRRTFNRGNGMATRSPFGRRFGTAARPQFGGASRAGGGQFGSPMGYAPMGDYEPMGVNAEESAGYPMGGYSSGGYGNLNDSDSSSYSKAMNDFYLAKIGIAGIMTIYRSPKERAAEGEQPATPETAAETQGEQPAAPETVEPVIDPETGKPVEPLIDPETGKPVIDPETGKLVTPLIDPNTGKPVEIPEVKEEPMPMPMATEPKPGEAPKTGEQPAPAAEQTPAPMNPVPMNPAPKGEPAPPQKPAGEPKPPAGNAPMPNPTPPQKPAPSQN